MKLTDGTLVVVDTSFNDVFMLIHSGFGDKLIPAAPEINTSKNNNEKGNCQHGFLKKFTFELITYFDDKK